MSLETAYQMQVGAGTLLLVVSALLVALQLDRVDSYRRQIAISSIVVFITGATAIWYLEEIKAFVWETPLATHLARARQAGAGWSNGHQDAAPSNSTQHGRAGEGDLPDDAAGEADAADAVNVADAVKNATFPARVRGNRFQECADCPEMVLIAGGLDGSTIPSFAIGRFELTLSEFHAFIAQADASAARRCEGQPQIAVTWDRRIDGAGLAPTYMHSGLHDASARPVTCISWQDALAYAAWLSDKTGQSYRLPTAREWTYVAQDGTPAIAHTSTTAALLHRVSLAETAPSIGAAPSNAFGVFDMAGSVAEWVNACAPGGTGPRTCDRQALGGTWADGASVTQTRSASPSRASALIGFRVVRDLPRH